MGKKFLLHTMVYKECVLKLISVIYMLRLVVYIAERSF